VAKATERKGSQPASSRGASRAAGNGRRIALRPATLSIPSAASAGARFLLEKIATAANAARHRFADRITQGAAAIAARAGQTQQALRAAGIRHASALRGTFRTSRTQIERAAGTAQAQVQADGTRHEAALAQSHAASAARAQTDVAAKQNRARGLGNSYAQRVERTANETAGQYNTTISRHEAEALAIGRGLAQRGSAAEVAEAKRKVATDIAQDTASKISEGTAGKAEELLGTAPGARDTFLQQGEGVAGQLETGLSGFNGQLGTVFGQASGVVQQTWTANVQQLGHAKTQLTGQLSSSEHDVLSQLHEHIELQGENVNANADQAATVLQSQGDKTLAAGDWELAQLWQSIATATIPVNQAPTLAQPFSTQVAGAFDGAASQTDNLSNQIGTGLLQAGAQIAAVTQSGAGTLAHRVQGTAGLAAEQMAQQRQAVAANLQTIGGQVGAAGMTAVAQFSGGLDTSLGQTEQAFTRGLGDYRTYLTDQVATAGTTAHEPVGTLGGRITEAQQRAAHRAERGWWLSQWDDFVDMLSDPGFWAGLLVGLVIAILIIAAIPSGGGTLVLAAGLIAAGALGGAAGAFAGSVVGQASGHSFRPSQWGQHVDWGQVGHSTLVGFLAGAAAGALVFAAAYGGVAAGLATTIPAFLTSAWIIPAAMLATIPVTIVTNWANDEPLTKGLLANMFFAGLLAGLARRFGGGRGRTPDPEVDPIPKSEPDPETPPEPVSVKLTIRQRLAEYFRRLGTAPRAGTAEEALRQVRDILNQVEDEFSGIPKKDPPPPPNQPDGRMYPPLDDFTTRHPDGSITATTKGHKIEIGPNGSITIRGRANGNVEFQKDGR
jgi:hypothetical protein